MDEQKLKEQKRQAQVDEWKAEIDKLKAKLSGSSADAQLEIKKQIDALQERVKSGTEQLAAMKDAAKSALGEQLSKFKL